MYKYLVAFVLISPLVGILLMEAGEYGPSIGMEGYRNGATIAFIVYALVVSTVAWGISRAFAPRPVEPDFELQSIASDSKFLNASCFAVLVNGAVLFIMLFGFGGLSVWVGELSKGEFRAGLGAFGAVAYLCSKWVAPALLAYLTHLYVDGSRSRWTRRLLLFNFAMVFLTGAAWGFKSQSLAMILPALLIYYWSVGFRRVIWLGVAAFLILLVFFFLFDADREVYGSALGFLFTRLTVIQGDVSWWVWELNSRGAELPGYWKTLLAVIGDKALGILAGLSRSDYSTWVEYHYDLLITEVSNVPLWQIEEGHSITGTPFSEGLVALGTPGVLVFAILAGTLAGANYTVIARALRAYNPRLGAVAATYFVMVTFSWLNGGAIAQLVHVGTIAGMVIAWGAVSLAGNLRIIGNSRLGLNG